MFAPFCINLQHSEDMASGLLLPSSFGISVILVGLVQYVPTGGSTHLKPFKPLEALRHQPDCRHAFSEYSLPQVPQKILFKSILV
ncbi:hypothetical protein U2J09_22590 [Serratia liquefaciens]|uniref:hypothetical protein n=1 Tax=Serratia liquefaciens TaxID=614 RepID=UPI0032DE9D1B